MARRADRVLPEGEAPTTSKETAVDLSKDSSYVATQEELFAIRVAEIEDDIITMFSQGASLSQINRRFPKYSPHMIAELINSRLTITDSALALLPGMQIRGFNDDLRQLSLLVEDKSVETKDKLKALELRTKTRSTMIDYLQDEGILKRAQVRDDDENSKGGGIFGLQPSTVIVNFEKMQTPEERLKYIEDLASQDAVNSSTSDKTNQA